MRRVFFAFCALVLLALDWAALHDIIKGEPNVWMEWTFVIASMMLFGAAAFRKLRGEKHP